MNFATVYQLIVTKRAASPYLLLRSVGLALIVTVGLVLLGALLGRGQGSQYIPMFYIAMMVLASIELGSHTFNEFKHGRSATMWLTLPASQAEKWMSNFLTSFLITPLVFLVIMTTATFIGHLIILSVGLGSIVNIFNPFSDDAFSLLKTYWVLHPLLFFGAIYFKKRSVLKVTASVALLMIFWFIYTGILVEGLFSSLTAHIDPNTFSYENDLDTFSFFGGLIEFNNGDLKFTNTIIAKIITGTVFYGYFLFFWGMSYLRLKELEL